MNYKVLYRRYRPDSFEELIGQKPIVEILKNSIKESKIAHAYIFSGPRGTGKTSTARVLAKSINCLEPKDGVACGKCTNCQSFATSPDIIEIDAASNNSVDEVRELINNVKIMPTHSKYKVYIIDEVHMLTKQAFNALLLTLEEPPSHIIFILATTNLESVPITILSRCQKFDFKRISQKDVLNQLKYICENEKIDYDEEALNEIAVLSEGGLRDALSILDQLSKSTEKITLESVINDVGTISNQRINELLDAIDENDIEKASKILDEFRNSSFNFKTIIKKMIDRIGFLAVQSLKNGIVHHLSYDDYKKMVMELNDIINKINISVDPYLILEIMLLGYVDNQSKNEPKVEKNEEKPQKIEEKIEKLPKIEENTQKSEEIPQNSPIKRVEQPKFTNSGLVDVRINNCFVGASKDNLNNIKELWQSFIKEATDAKLRGLITDTLPVLASNTHTILSTSIPHKDKELNNELSLIQESFKKAFDKDLKMVFIDEKAWALEKEKYIKNLQSGKKYEMQPEETPEEPTQESVQNDIEKLATDIFAADKIEVE